jgi:hypothetical protein
MKTARLSRRVYNRLSPGVVAAAALLLAGCHATDDRVESVLERELPKLLGPADRYEVDVEGVESDASAAEAVDVIGYRIRPRQGPVIDRLSIELRDVQYDRENKRLERAESAHATAWITAADLADFLEQQDGISDATVTLGAPDSVFLRVRPNLGGLVLLPGAAVEVAGTIEGRGPYLEYDVADVEAVGLNLGDWGSRRLTRLINPLIDLSGLPLRLDVTAVRVEGRTVRLDAEGDATPLRP